jgi:N-methylhydantoinase A
MTNVAVRHCFDPRDFSLVAYGAAGGMLLPATLEVLPVKRVIVPPHPGLFSAIGLLSTDLVYYGSRSAYTLFTPEAATGIAEVYHSLEEELRSRVGQDDGVIVRRTFDGRLVGQSWETPFVDVPEGPITEATVSQMIAAFHDTYEQRFGNRFEAMPVEGVTYRVQVIVPSQKHEYVAQEPGDGSPLSPTRITQVRHYGPEPLQVPEYEREELPPGTSFAGPAIIREALSTTFVCPGQRAEIGRFGEIVIELDQDSTARGGEK